MQKNQLTPLEALERLRVGNHRFATGVLCVESLASILNRKELATKGQRPFAIILTCSDSRVPAETVFDAGLGDLFVIRVAGNILAPSLIASIEFAALTFDTPLCLVMGHSKCGAIHSAVTGVLNKQKSLTKNLDILIDHIEPAARQALEGSPMFDNIESSDDHRVHQVVHKAIHLNIKQTMKELHEASPHLRSLIAQNTFKVQGAFYNLETGVVEFMPEDAR